MHYREEVKYDRYLSRREEILVLKKVEETVLRKAGEQHILKREDFPFDNLLEADFHYQGVSLFSLTQIPWGEEQQLKQCARITYSHFFRYRGKYYLRIRWQEKK